MLINDSKKRYEEEQKIQWLRRYSDLVVNKLRTENFTEIEAAEFLESVKRKILERFPDKEEQYNIIYERRFKRVLLKKGICLKLYSGNSLNNYN